MKFPRNFVVQIYLFALIYVTIKIQDGESSNALFIAIFVMLSNMLVLISLIIFPGRLWREKAQAHKCIITSEYMAFSFGVLAIHLLAIGAGGYYNLLGSWLIIKDQLEDNDLYRSLSMISYCVAVGYYIHWRLTSEKKQLFWDMGLFLSLVTYAFAIKVKLFMVAPLLALALEKSGKTFGYKKTIRYSIVFLFSYLAVMTTRWVGDFENLSYDAILDTLVSVGDAGIERELLHQSSSVFEYYQENDFNYGQSIRRILMSFFSIFGLVNELPENPMYKYFAISNGGVYVEGASAHPSVYADSFGEWGWFGVFVPSLYLIVFSWVSKKYIGRILDAISLSFLFISMPLLVRGSTYYGYMYLLLAIILIVINDLIKYATIHKKQS